MLYLSIAWWVFCPAFAAHVWAQGGTGRYPPPPPTPKKVSKTKPPATVIASGEVRPLRYVTLASETVGRVQQIIVNPGELVKKNQSLVVIDSSEQTQAAVQQAAIKEAEQARDSLLAARQSWDRADADVTQAKKDAAAADTEYSTADREFKRTKGLLEAGIVSRAENDAASERLDRARAKWQERNLLLKQANERADQQRAVVNDAQTKAQSTGMRANYLATLILSQSNRRDKVTQVSPLDCIVADIPVREGELVMQAGTTLMTLADMSAIYIEVDVEEGKISQFESGQPVRIRVDAIGEEEITGVVRGKEPQRGINPSEPKQFKVKVEMREMSKGIRNRLRPGMSATATITTGGRR